MCFIVVGCVAFLNMCWAFIVFFFFFLMLTHEREGGERSRFRSETFGENLKWIFVQGILGFDGRVWQKFPYKSCICLGLMTSVYV